MGRQVESIVGGHFTCRLPHRLDRIELGRIRWQPKESDVRGVVPEPSLTVLVEIMTGAVVDNEEHLAASVLSDEVLEKYQERLAVEDVRELIVEAGLIETDRAKEMGGLALTESVYARLLTDSRPGTVECSVEPKADLVSEQNDASTLGGFFLIAGNFSLIHTACFSKSARANRLRGRCIEKPNLWSKWGT